MKRTMLAKVRAYLAERRALGYQLSGDGYLLRSFARYADRQGHQGPLTCSLVLSWACLPKMADRLYWARRLAAVRRFARHLLRSEPQTRVPPRHLLGPLHRRRCPHLYSSAQLQGLRRRAGQLRGSLRPHTWQTLLGLLACAGLRHSEALRLRPEDVDWPQSVLLIRESKYGKSRLVPLHRSAIKPLRAYAERRRKRFPLAQYFFVSEQGTGLAHTTVQRTFRQLRKGIPFTRRPPRLHDLRHTLASTVLQRAVASRKGVANRVLILSRFLGHSHVEHTYWYLSALPQLLAQAAQRFALKDDENV
jgi:integrase